MPRNHLIFRSFVPCPGLSLIFLFIALLGCKDRSTAVKEDEDNGADSLFYYSIKYYDFISKEEGVQVDKWEYPINFVYSDSTTETFIWHYFDEEENRYILDCFLADGSDGFGTMNLDPTYSEGLDFKFVSFLLTLSLEEQIAMYQFLGEVNFLTEYSSEYIASSPQLSPDQSCIIFDLFQKSEDRHYLVRVDTSGANEQMIGEYTFSEKTTNAENFRISRDGQKVFFIREREVWSTDIATQASEEITTLLFSPRYLAISPNEDKIAFITDDSGYSGVYYVDLNEKQLVDVKQEGHDFGAVGFRNEHQLVFSRPGRQGGLYSYDLSTKKLTKLIEGDVYNRGVSVFNKDHSKIYYLVAEQ